MLNSRAVPVHAWQEERWHGNRPTRADELPQRGPFWRTPKASDAKSRALNSHPDFHRRPWTLTRSTS